MIDYSLRGKCKEMAEALVTSDPSLRLVRGHYYCSAWGEQAHWWCEDKDGKVIDPTAAQFPSNGTGEYIEFDGMCECAECGESVEESKASFGGNGRYAFCSYTCEGRFIGVF